MSTWLTSAPIRQEAGGRLVDGHRWDGFAREAGVIAGVSQWRDRLATEEQRRREELAAMRATEQEGDAGGEARIAGLGRRVSDIETMRAFLDELFELATLRTERRGRGSRCGDAASSTATWARPDRRARRGSLGPSRHRRGARRAGNARWLPDCGVARGVHRRCRTRA